MFIYLRFYGDRGIFIKLEIGAQTECRTPAKYTVCEIFIPFLACQTVPNFFVFCSMYEKKKSKMS
jgi:hypothetical protein